MTTVSDLIEETRRQLLGMHRGQVNFLNADVTDSDNVMEFEDEIRGIVQGSVLSIDDELMYVRQSQTSSKSAIVLRGWLGSVPSLHTASTLVDVAPRFPRLAIRNALRDEIRSWGMGIYRVVSVDIAVPSGDRSIDLSTLDPGWFHILGVYREAAPGFDADVALRGKTVRSTPQFPYGAFIMENPLFGGTSARVTAAVPFVVDPFDDDIDLQDDIGLDESMFDIPPIGAAWRLLSPREINRLDPGAQGEPRSATEIQGGMMASVARGYKALRDQRLFDESSRLRSRWPWRM